MFLENTVEYVNCPITGAKFHVVGKEYQKNIILFEKWADDVINRANLGKTINISIDCEGYLLGTIQKSLSCIQIGEIFDDDFDVYQNKAVPNVGQNEGFLILNPMSDKVQEILTNVLTLHNIMIYTFDFIGDFATMFEAGIKINTLNVFDSQVATQLENSNFIQNKSGKSLSWFVEEAENYDLLGEKANIMKNIIFRDKRNYFCVTSYLFKDCKNPANEILTKELLEMGAADVYMTGLAASYCIQNGLTQKVLVDSRTKVIQFWQFVYHYKSYLAPSICRHLFFIDSYSAWKYDNNQFFDDKTENDLLDLLRVYQDTFSIMCSFKILNHEGSSKISLKRAEEFNHAATLKLEKNRKRLIKMMDDYA